MAKKNRIAYDKQGKQKEFHDDDISKILALSAGFGSGKTYALIMKTIKLSYVNKYYHGGFLAPTLPEFKRDCLPLFEEILDDNRVPFFYHKTDKYFHFPWMAKKKKLFIFSGEVKIRGPNLAYGAINEASLIKYVRFKEMLGRVRVKGAPCLQLACSFTPEGIGHWTYEHFVEKPRPKTNLIYGDTRDNSYLDEDYIPLLEENYDPIMLDSYLKGLFVNMNGYQFYYSFDRRRNCDESIERDWDLPVHVSLDFNVDPMAAGLWNIKGKTHYKFGEIELKANSATHATTDAMCDELKELECFPDNTIIYPDPSGDSRGTTNKYNDIQILKNNGYYDIRFKRKAPSFRRRQLCMNNLFSKRLIMINPKECPKSVKDFEAVEQNPADFTKIKTNIKLTHFSDGDDYFIDYNNPLSGTKPSVTSQRIR